MVQQSIEEAKKQLAELQAEVGREPPGRELALAATKLEEAELWIEKAKAISEGRA